MCRERLRRSKACFELLILCTVMVMAGGCVKSTPPELAQLVLRQELKKIPADFVVCVAIDDRDADTAALRGLGQSNRTLVPASECEWVRDISKGSYHRASGKKAMLLSVKSNASRTSVDVVARHSGLWATTTKLKVSDSGGAWRIVDVLKEEHA
jgi:hypothetical protein